MIFKIVNYSSVAVNVNTLTILGWFQGQAGPGYWGGDPARTTVYDALGNTQGTGQVQGT